MRVRVRVRVGIQIEAALRCADYRIRLTREGVGEVVECEGFGD